MSVIAARAVVDSAHGLPGDLVAIDATLETPVDDSTAAAKYDNGVLKLVLPKKADGNGRRLTVG